MTMTWQAMSARPLFGALAKGAHIVKQNPDQETSRQQR